MKKLVLAVVLLAVAGVATAKDSLIAVDESDVNPFKGDQYIISYNLGSAPLGRLGSRSLRVPLRAGLLTVVAFDEVERRMTFRLDVPVDQMVFTPKEGDKLPCYMGELQTVKPGQIGTQWLQRNGEFIAVDYVWAYLATSKRDLPGPARDKIVYMRVRRRINPPKGLVYFK